MLNPVAEIIDKSFNSAECYRKMLKKPGTVKIDQQNECPKEFNRPRTQDENQHM